VYWTRQVAGEDWKHEQLWTSLTVINGWKAVMLSPRGQAGLEAIILSLASDSASKMASASASSICPRPVLELFILALWKWVMMEMVIILSLQWLSTKVIYLPCVIDINLFKFKCCPSWEIFSQSGLIVSACRAHVKRCPRDIGLLEVQFSLVSRGRSLQLSLWF